MEQDLRYPVGEFDWQAEVSPDMVPDFISTIEQLPAKMRAAVNGMDADQLNTEYRPGGWTVKQVTHHVADSHMNSFIRFKLGVTEDVPTIKPYAENEWAQGADYSQAPIELSLQILDALHTRWTILLRSMTDADFAREINHPDNGRMTLAKLLALYDWHSRHHTAHITELRKRNNW